MNKEVYYRESEWWNVPWIVVILFGFFTKSTAILFLTSIGLLIVTIVLNRTRQIRTSQKRRSKWKKIY